MFDQATASEAGYALDLTVAFKHCDPAGMVFYPRYVEMLNDVVESWFEQGLGCDYHALHLQRRISIPTVSLNCRFVRPSRLGDRLVARLSVGRVGRSSLALEHRITGRNDTQDLRMSAQHVIVFVDMDSTSSIEVPPDLLAPICRFLVTTADRHD